MPYNNSLEIVSGPSREELFDALKYKYKGFKITLTVDIHITSAEESKKHGYHPSQVEVEAEVSVIGTSMDDKGMSWEFKIISTRPFLGRTSHTGVYNTKTRNGKFYL